MPAYLLPLAVVIALALLVPRRWMFGPKRKSAAVVVLLICVALLILRYLWWRLTTTLPGPETGLGEAVFVWALLAFEMAGWVDTAILFLTVSRRRDNSAAADRFEEQLRQKRPDELPDVDVFIATYNEDLEVLEKTIVGALNIDWPADRLKIYVLDDGKRAWLSEYCAAKGVHYLTRDSNAHAKAGNINAAISRTDGEFFLVLDADFVPQRNFLYRAMGFFNDPKVGIVQIPHCFYNADPMQKNLGLRDVMPDDQRMFFDTIMPSRDAWNNAFCCGSNGITRRAAMEEIGGGLPTGSITEDMLLTLTLLRKGYITRFLNERLAVGLAPESLSAMYVQRARWARGAIQMLFLRDGPLGPGLKLHQRAMFLPLHWISQPVMLVAMLLTPPICLWTGWNPLPSATMPAIIAYQFPAVIATLTVLRLLAPRSYFPIAATVHSALQAPRIIPTVLTTLIKPHGHAFKVTPKGSAAGGTSVDRLMVFAPAALIVITALGLYLNTRFNTRVLSDGGQVHVLAFWAFVSMIILSIVQVVAVTPDHANHDEIFKTNAPCTIRTQLGEKHSARIETLSMTSAGIRLEQPVHIPQNVKWLRLELNNIGAVQGYILHQEGAFVEILFELQQGATRDALLRYLFTDGIDNSTDAKSSLHIATTMIGRILRIRRPRTKADVLTPMMRS